MVGNNYRQTILIYIVTYLNFRIMERGEMLMQASSSIELILQSLSYQLAQKDMKNIIILILTFLTLWLKDPTSTCSVHKQLINVK